MDNENNEDSQQDSEAINRRRFLKIAGASAVGTAGLIMFGSPSDAKPKLDTQLKTVATELTPGSTQHIKIRDNFRFASNRVQLVEMNGTEMMHLNGIEQPHEVFARLDNGRYMSHLLPYEEFKDPKKLITQLMENNGRLFVLKTG